MTRSSSSFGSSNLSSGSSSLRKSREVLSIACLPVVFIQSQTALPRSSWTTLPVGTPCTPRTGERAPCDPGSLAPQRAGGTAGRGRGLAPGRGGFRVLRVVHGPCPHRRAVMQAIPAYLITARTRTTGCEGSRKCGGVTVAGPCGRHIARVATAPTRRCRSPRRGCSSRPRACRARGRNDRVDRARGALFELELVAHAPQLLAHPGGNRLVERDAPGEATRARRRSRASGSW